MVEPLRIRNYSELVAVVPHLLGFHPEESLVCMPTNGAGPHARIDLPRTDADRREVAESLLRGYANSPGAVVVVAFTAHQGDAERAIQAIEDHTDGVLSIGGRLQVHNDRWTNLYTGESGPVDPDDISRHAAEAVLRGRAMPAPSRESLRHELAGGDPAGVATHLDTAIQTAREVAASPGATAREARWITGTIQSFLDTQHPLPDAAAARLLADVQHLQLRDVTWATMDRAEAGSHVALWRDLTRRAPEQVRDPAASLLAFSSWLNGDGARAWVALDTVQDPDQHPLALLVGKALTNGIPPSAWSSPEPAATTEVIEPPTNGMQAPHRPLGPRREPGPERGF